MDFESLLELVRSNNPPRLCTDSRLTRPGDCFIALRGTQFDGHDFINNAVKAGAKYIVRKSGSTSGTVPGVAFIDVSDTTEAAAILAQALNGNPSSRLTNLAVTGTNGKTTVAFLVHSVFKKASLKCGLIGTVLYDTGAQIIEAPLTTPDCLTIAETQKQMLKAGAKYMVIEASSHALSQNRLAGINFAAAAFTNLTGDHLDYHKTEQAYLDAKTKLFENLSADSTAILNSRSPHCKEIAKKTNAKILWYGIEDDSNLTAEIKSMDTDGTRFDLRFENKSCTVTTPLLGLYNVSNNLAAAGLCLVAGLELETIAKGLTSFENVPGRLERLDFEGDYTVLIDYAHTDDALKNVLSTLRPLCKGRLIVVFGCGGDRDRTKRPRMAAVAEQSADVVIVTSDNPRTEEPMKIIGDIVTGFEKPSAENILVEPDRKKAVHAALKLAAENDIVLIAGKGHENYQIIGKSKIPFSDKQTAAECLAKAR